jgi:PAS domain S-box-containing protein
MDRAGLEFVIDCAPSVEPAYVDRDMWEKIILNLVSNAFKFTLAGRIAVRLKQEDDWFELSVEDTGIGIPDHELSRIFNRFHRVEGARGRTHEGTGIGLALVQELSRLHGGSTRVETAVGKGSAFVVTIPKGSAHLPAEHLGSARTMSATAVVASAYVDEALRWLPELDRQAVAAPLFAADTVQASHVLKTSGRILLADDNADMRDYVRRLLGEYYEIQTAGNGVEALKAAREHPPDLVLTDVMMPELDGFGLLHELRAGEETRTIPVILLSARAGEDARIEGLAAGADDYIVKPFTARELLARVSAHLSINRLRIEAADRERALRGEAEAAREHVTAILESISDAFLAFDRHWRFTYVNAEAERTTGKTRDELIGRDFWDVFPETRGTNLETQYCRAMADRVAIQFENYYRPWQRWFEIRVYPAKDQGVSVFYQDITKRKEIEEAMRRSNEALQAANTDLEQFAYSASHDLREPLRAIRIYCQLLKQTYAGQLDSKADEMIKFCVDGAQRMNVLIDDLLDFINASSNLTVQPEAVSLESALAGALLNLEAAIAETGAAVTHDSMPALRVALVHAEQLFQNLIGNALKYHSAAPPVIHIGARRENAQWIFSVKDNGIGIGPEHRETVFELCKRLHADSEYPGTGVGLAICKKLVERYGGRIWVESEFGKGATFFFSIPEPG